MVDYLSDSLISPSRAAARIDELLSRVALEYPRLPRRRDLALLFRECLSAHGLPGGYIRPGAVARSLSESLKGQGQC